ncbi:hypothetical protein PspLS_10096 [Pyricularia sp. CBS 133598]|nr:hypothetical protein PspLS_10096 [Pyricularia sp. CBS 133598]
MSHLAPQLTECRYRLGASFSNDAVCGSHCVLVGTVLFGAGAALDSTTFGASRRRKTIFSIPRLRGRVGGTLVLMEPSFKLGRGSMFQLLQFRGSKMLIFVSLEASFTRVTR